MVKAWANVWARLNWFKTIFQFCLGYEHIVDMLIEKAENINAKGQFNNTALILAASKGTRSWFSNEIKKFDCVTLYFWNELIFFEIHFINFWIFYNLLSWYLGLLKAVNSLIQKGVDINAVNVDGFTALMSAADWGNFNLNEVNLNVLNLN